MLSIVQLVLLFALLFVFVLALLAASQSDARNVPDMFPVAIIYPVYMLTSIPPPCRASSLLVGLIALQLIEF